MRVSTLVVLWLLLPSGGATTTAEQQQQQQHVTTSSSSTTTNNNINGMPVCAANGDCARTLISPHQPQCGLYMAPSTLGEEANLGMYAGMDYTKDTIVQHEIALPLLFRDWEGPSYYHDNGFDPQLSEEEIGDGALWYRYIWSGWVADLESYETKDTSQSKVVFVPGIGCTINSILDACNVQSTHGSAYDTAGIARNDVGSGAFGPYHRTNTTALVDIPAGSEIFADYGDEWIPDIPGAQITFHNVMDAAEDFLRDEYLPFVNQHRSQLSDHVLEGLWKFTRDLPHPNPRTFTVLPRQVEWKDVDAVLQDRVAQELQASPQPVDHTLTADNDDQQDEHDDHNAKADFRYREGQSVIRHFVRQQSQRSLEWLDQHGRCCDHMRADISTIPHAGFGAFATRDLPQGTRVGYSPLIHVGTHGTQLYQVPYTFGSSKDKTKNYRKPDLIVNYSFQHANSTVLLTPYGSMVNYINHSPTQPNVRVVWPADELMAHKPDWLTKDVFFLTHTVRKIGLSFEYVAIRDIAEGEEILLDYGPEWQAAWEEHVATWTPPRDADVYVHSTHMDPNEPLKTPQELATSPYPPNLRTLCIPSYQTDPQPETGDWVWIAPHRTIPDRVPCTVVQRVNNNNNNTSSSTTSTHDGFLYTVHMDFDDETRTIRQVPRKAIFLTDKIMSQDWHGRNAFRHPIGIPDDMFPQAWRNLE